MSKNNSIYKPYQFEVQAEEKLVIDNNTRMAQRLEKLEEEKQRLLERQRFLEEESSEFTEGLEGEEIDALLEDAEYDEEGNIIKAAPAYSGPSLEEIQMRADEIINAAMAEAEDIQERAKASIDADRMEAIKEGEKQGFDEGYRKAMLEAENMKIEVEEKKRQLEREYDRLIQHLEPQFIDVITDVYNYVFGIQLESNHDILIYLVDRMLRKIEASNCFIVHVSKEDYQMVMDNKEMLSEQSVGGRGRLDIIEDIALSGGECLIETDGGLFDCGIDTQLQVLTAKLKALSYERSES